MKVYSNYLESDSGSATFGWPGHCWTLTITLQCFPGGLTCCCKVGLTFPAGAAVPILPYIFCDNMPHGHVHILACTYSLAFSHSLLLVSPQTYTDSFIEKDMEYYN